MQDWLLDGFRYDLWANRLWLPVAGCDWEEVADEGALDELPDEPQARMRNVFTHIVWGQKMWLDRLGAPVAADGEAWLEALHEGWLGLVRAHDPEEPLRYERPTGDTVERPMSDVAWMLINHGTYHRGQLREIADRAGLDYPETDVTVWRKPLIL